MKATRMSIAIKKAKAERILAKAFEDEYAGLITSQERVQIESKYSPVLNQK